MSEHDFRYDPARKAFVCQRPGCGRTNEKTAREIEAHAMRQTEEGAGMAVYREPCPGLSP